MAIVIEFLVLKVLTPGVQTFQPDMTIGTVNREMIGNEELQSAADMSSESMLRVREITGAINRGKIPTAAAENERRHTSGAQGIDEQG